MPADSDSASRCKCAGHFRRRRYAPCAQRATECRIRGRANSATVLPKKTSVGFAAHTSWRLWRTNLGKQAPQSDVKQPQFEGCGGCPAFPCPPPAFPHSLGVSLGAQAARFRMVTMGILLGRPEVRSRSWARKGALRARIWTNFLISGLDFGRGGDLRGPGTILRIAPESLKSAPQPKLKPEKRISPQSEL